MQMGIERLPYRVQQAVKYVVDRPAPADRELVASLLSPALMHLFQSMSPGDRAHAIRVCRALQDRDITDRTLLRAALLHDVGKAEGVSLPHRVAYTLLKRLAPGLLARLCAQPASGWRQPLVKLHRHPEIGARLAADAGASPDVVALIRAHQDGNDVPAHLTTALGHLQRADDLN